MTQPSAISVEHRVITVDAAAVAAAAAVAHAKTLGVRINVAVTDGAGVLMAFLRMPGAFLHSIQCELGDGIQNIAGFVAAQAARIFFQEPAALRRLPNS